MFLELMKSKAGRSLHFYEQLNLFYLVSPYRQFKHITFIIDSEGPVEKHKTN